MSLRHAFLSGSRWVALSSASLFIIQLLQTIVLARLLSPGEFGVMAIGGGLLAIMATFADVGLSRALIHYRNLTLEVLSSMFWLNFLVSVAIAGVVAMMSPLVAALFDLPELVGVLATGSVMFPIAAIGMQFRILAEKELSFASLARNETGAALIGFATAVSLAIQGAGVYALVGGGLASTAASSLFAWWWLSAGKRPALRLHVAEVRPYLAFGGYLVGERVAGTLNNQADVFIGGLVAGPSALGIYSMPRALSLRLANTFVNPVASRVGFPVLATIQHDPEAMRAVYLNMLRMTASINFPVYLLLAFFASAVVHVLYGQRWHDAAFYLILFAVWGMLRSMGNPVGSLLAAVGRARAMFVWGVAKLTITVPMLWIAGLFGGLESVAKTMVAVQIAVVVPAWFFLVRPSCGASLSQYLRCFTVPLGVALLAITPAAWLTRTIEDELVRLMVGGTISALLYIALSYRFNRVLIKTMITLVFPRIAAQTHQPGARL